VSLLKLRDYQGEAVEAVERDWRDGIRRPALAMATGSGKTATASHLISRRDVQTLFLVHRDELGAASVDDLDPVLARLAEGLAQARPASELAELDTITEREARPRLKRATDALFGLRLASTMALNRADPDRRTGTASGLSLLWLYDSGQFLADVDLGFVVSNLEEGRDRDHAVTLGMGIYVPFTKTDLTPYAGGGLAYSWANVGGGGANGLVARAGGGILVGRLSRVVVRLDASWFYSLFTERERVSGKEVNVTGVIASIALTGAAK